MALNTLTAVVLTELIVLLTTVIFMEPVSDLDTPEKVAKAIVLLVSLIVLTALFTIYFMQALSEVPKRAEDDDAPAPLPHVSQSGSTKNGNQSAATKKQA